MTSVTTLSFGQRLTSYAQLMRWHKLKPTLLLLWPCYWALWIAAQGFPGWKNFIIFSLGVFIMRSAGCVINDYADRHLDAHVARTRERPLAQQKITTREALWLFAGLCLLAFALVLCLNELTILLSFVALALACLYPFMKRYTYFPQIVLGMAWYMGIPMAFAAVQNTVPLIAWYLYLLAVIWAVIYDTMYAMVDRKDDIKIGIKSTALLFGRADRMIIAMLQFCLILLLFLLGRYYVYPLIYFVGIAVAAVFFVYQQYLIKERQETQCLRGFLNNIWFGLVVFLSIVVATAHVY